MTTESNPRKHPNSTNVVTSNPLRPTDRRTNFHTANPAQNCFVKVTYTAPTVVTGAMTGRRDAAVLATANEAPAAEVNVYPNPTTSDRIDLVIQANREQVATHRSNDLGWRTQARRGQIDDRVGR